MKLVQQKELQVSGEYLQIEGEPYYCIHNYDRMKPFLISVVSDTDLWLYISSMGGLTAGRKGPDTSIFPYYTDDKLHDAYHETGSFTRVIVNPGSDDQELWCPFSPHLDPYQQVTRNLYKNKFGNKLIFEEHNEALNLTFRYGWFVSDQWGLVRKSWLINNGDEAVDIRLLDGIRNVLPWGIQRLQQMTLSTLMDAYKKSERVENTELALFRLSSIPVDRAEPSEALRTNIVWSKGLEDFRTLLSDNQIKDFVAGLEVQEENEIRARRGAYLKCGETTLPGGQTKSWTIVADVEKDHADIAAMVASLTTAKKIDIDKDIDRGTTNLDKLVAKADGIQVSSIISSVNRHYSNTLFNIMRGGVFANNYQIQIVDFISHLETANRSVAARFSTALRELDSEVDLKELSKFVETQKDPDLVRLSHEYLPLLFGRRHGDPSRPWNIFEIQVKDRNGERMLSYEGNWRDIFQNWEALLISYPAFITNILSKFLNASTPDGYNPYRISRGGIDWEVLEPDDSWSYVGYWGDHQIVYFSRLLEFAVNHYPENSKRLLSQRMFAFANVPYRIKEYDEIVENPFDTIVFDHLQHTRTVERAAQIGSDGRLLWNGDNLQHASFADKILIQLLTKLYNFIPDAGIWLNTQRPEWNDANNALVGNGASMVTVYYLQPYVQQLISLFQDSGELSVLNEVSQLFHSLNNSYFAHQSNLEGGFDATNRRKFVDAIGSAGSSYRQKIYNEGFSGVQSSITEEELIDFLSVVAEFLNHSIHNNKREDGLYHSYNLLQFEHETLQVRHLYEMLEGQASVLSSGLLSPEEVTTLLRQLYQSKMYREDQDSFTLYPDRKLKSFIESNLITSEQVSGSQILNDISESKGGIIVKDPNGNLHFNAEFRNVSFLIQKMEEQGFKEAAIDEVAAVYEEVFNHLEFTGRSGTFFAYEGLGSIYWHMVSKLLVSIQENFWKGYNQGADAAVLQRLKDLYYKVRAGIGYDKTPEQYGSFPTDAYSHTPANSGVRQPGLTGQVKEDIISRFAELGVRVHNGTVTFNPSLLRVEEFIDHKSDFHYYDVNEEFRTISIPKDSLAFTYCQVPVIYQLSDSLSLSIETSDGTTTSLDSDLSGEIFFRTGRVKMITVAIDRNSIL